MLVGGDVILQCRLYGLLQAEVDVGDDGIPRRRRGRMEGPDDLSLRIHGEGLLARRAPEILLVFVLQTGLAELTRLGISGERICLELGGRNRADVPEHRRTHVGTAVLVLRIVTLAHLLYRDAGIFRLVLIEVLDRGHRRVVENGDRRVLAVLGVGNVRL